VETLKFIDIDTKEIYDFTVDEMIEEINRDRSGTWSDYNKYDWVEGMVHFTNWRKL
jgi:hypothetical protein